MPDETEVRLADIQASVHRIEGAQTLFERRLDKTDGRMTELERTVVEVKAEQRGAEKIMTSEHVRLHEKIDGIYQVLRDHIEREDKDRRSLVGLSWSTFLALAGALAWWAFERLTAHGG